jgi:methionine sulfoxide reductase heme-binding subunit
VNWSAVTWDAARAGGLVALVLLTASVACGLLLGLRAASPRWPRFLTSDLHGFLSMAALGFIAIHVGALWLDPFTRFGPTEMLVPFASHYRPLPTALGIVALDLVLAVWATTRLRARIGYTLWKRLHYATYVIYGAALIHGIGAGTDTRTPWAQAVYVVSGLVVIPLVMARVLGGADRRPVRWASAGAVVVAAMAALVWAGRGPLRSPARARAAEAPPRVGRVAVADPFRTGFRARLVGLVRETPDDDGAVTIRLGAALHGHSGLLEVMLHGAALPGGGVTVSDTAVLLGSTPARPLYRGRVTALDGGSLTAVVARPGSGGRLVIRVALNPITRGHVTGSAVASPIPS